MADPISIATAAAAALAVAAKSAGTLHAFIDRIGFGRGGPSNHQETMVSLRILEDILYRVKELILPQSSVIPDGFEASVAKVMVVVDDCKKTLEVLRTLVATNRIGTNFLFRGKSGHIERYNAKLRDYIRDLSVLSTYASLPRSRSNRESAAKIVPGLNSYSVGWVAALAIERAAAEAMLDEEHAPPAGFIKHPSDDNVYTWGRMWGHNIVIASIAPGNYGTSSAATTASNLLASLPSVRIGLLVGIGSGVARPDDHDIRLGDVVVSQPGESHGGVWQYVPGKAISGDKCELKGFLGRPPTVLLNALDLIRANHERRASLIPVLVEDMLEKNPTMGSRSKNSPSYAYQGPDNDRLFTASCIHIGGNDCAGCDAAGEVQREARVKSDPRIHYGIILSGNSLVKDAEARDQIIEDVGGDFLCLEMEAAGLMSHFPCLVIRGICDYADSHKNDRWQRYASATAAAYAKELLMFMPVTDIDRILRWLCPSEPSTNAKQASKLRHHGTGTWLLRSPWFTSWEAGTRQHLWVHGLAGTGKTVLSAMVVDHLASIGQHRVLSFFFEFNNSSNQTLGEMLRSLAFQLYPFTSGSPNPIDKLFRAHEYGRTEPATSALSDVVFELLSNTKTFIVLDALDESTTRRELLSWIKELALQPKLRQVQLLCTSRPYPEFQAEIPQDYCMSLDKGAINGDIRSYVRAELTHRQAFKSLSQELLEQIESTISEGSDGMFMFAAFQLDILAACPNIMTMKHALNTLPRTLSETYERILHSIPEELRANAFRLLRFLVHAPRPLTVAEAMDIIAIDLEAETQCFDIDARPSSEHEILRYCPGLLTVVEMEDNEEFRKQLRFAHSSIKEFLTTQPEFKRPLTTTFGNALQNVSREGHGNVVTLLVEMGADINEQGGMYGNALQAASVGGHGQIVVALLDAGADVNAPGGHFGNALQAASFNGHKGIVETLCARGADVNAQGGPYGNALQAAFHAGHKEIAGLLLDKGAKRTAHGANNETRTQASDSAYVSGTAGSVKPREQRQTDAAISEEADFDAQRDGESLIRSNTPAPSISETRYSGASSVLPENVGHYVSMMTALLQSMAPPGIFDGSTLQGLEQELPNMLKTFALDIGHTGLPSGYGEISLGEIKYFVYKHRQKITDLLRANCYQEIGNDEGEEQPRPKLFGHEGPMVTAKWKMSRYFAMISLSRDEDEEDHADGGEDSGADEDGFVSDDEEPDEPPEIGKYQEAVAKSAAFGRLLQSLSAAATRTNASPDVRKQIRERVIGSLYAATGPRMLSRSTPPQVYRATVEMKWHLRSFIAEQNYRYKSPELSPEEAIAGAVTLTGSSQDCQAATTLQYLLQTWPSSGRQTMQLLQRVLAGNDGDVESVTWPDRTTVTAWTSKSKFHMTAVGLAPSIAEAVEQLAWVGAALQPPRSGSGVQYCTPKVTCHAEDKTKTAAHGHVECSCQISFDFAQEGSKQDANGRCWHDMFRNPIVVRGYPFARRTATQTGLEMPLNMMARMVRATHVMPFVSSWFIKGFSSMLALAEQKGDMFLWHHVYDQGGGHVSHFDKRSPKPPSGVITAAALETGRHVVGWCSDVKHYAGALSDTVLNISDSGLGGPSATCVLEKVSLTAGKFITGGITVAIGVKESPIYLGSDDYEEMMEWVYRQYVIFWDEGNNRGWLVNGASALLHLVRAVLERHLTFMQEEGGRKPEDMLFKIKDLEETKPLTPGSALKVLLNQGNRTVAIGVRKNELSYDSEKKKHVVKTTYRLFEDVVEKQYRALEAVMNLQAHIEDRAGLNLKFRARKWLEGWDFWDLATESKHKAVHARLKTLQTVDHGWVDFAREINAITIFGKGFGDLIRPTTATAMCTRWKRVPGGQYYLAAGVSDLKAIMRPRCADGQSENPIRLCNGVYWHVIGGLFQACPCREEPIGGTNTTHSEDLAQVLAPSPKPLKRTPRSTSATVELKDMGAVIFGYRPSFGLKWPDEGDPVEEETEVDPPATDAAHCENNEAQTEPQLDRTVSVLEPPPARTTGLDDGEPGTVEDIESNEHLADEPPARSQDAVTSVDDQGNIDTQDGGQGLAKPSEPISGDPSAELAISTTTTVTTTSPPRGILGVSKGATTSERKDGTRPSSLRRIATKIRAPFKSQGGGK